MIRTIAGLSLGLIVTAADAQFTHGHGQPRYDALVLTDIKRSDRGKTVFSPDTRRLYLNARLVDVDAGMQAKSEWIVVKSKGVVPNSKIAVSEFRVEMRMGTASFFVDPPEKTWPVGDYRVDLYLNGVKSNSIDFKVE